MVQLFPPYLHTHKQLARPSWHPGKSMNPGIPEGRARGSAGAHQGGREGRLQSLTPGPGRPPDSRCSCFLQRYFLKTSGSWLACSLEQEERLPESPGSERGPWVQGFCPGQEACWIPGSDEQVQVRDLYLSQPPRLFSLGGLRRRISLYSSFYSLRLDF